MTVNVRFMPDNIVIKAAPGEPLLTVAARAGVHISTGCLMGSCHACEVEMTGSDDAVLACLTAVPKDTDQVDINLLVDPTW